jgi:tetratricopeptide (TPR) repeat protein
MPVEANSDVVHNATTDHRILRTPAKPAAKPPGPTVSELPLVLFHAEQVDAQERELMSRELAIGLTLEATQVADSPVRVNMAGMAVDLLDRALNRWPEDLVALRYKAQALALANRPRDGLRLFDDVIKRAPNYENALDERVLLALRAEIREAGLAPSKRAVDVNPWCAVFRERLAYYELEDGRWDETLRESSAALRLDPFLVNARKFLILSYLQRNDHVHAGEEFKTLMALHPTERESLRRWLGHQRTLLEQGNPTGRGG